MCLAVTQSNAREEHKSVRAFQSKKTGEQQGSCLAQGVPDLRKLSCLWQVFSQTV